MSSTDDIARLLNLGGADTADSTALAEVITDYWDEGAAPFEDSGLFTFFQTALFIQHASVQYPVEYSACSLAKHYRTDMNVHNNVLILF